MGGIDNISLQEAQLEVCAFCDFLARMDPVFGRVEQSAGAALG